MEFSYYGRMSPLPISILKKNGVFKFMLEEFIMKNIENLEQKLTKKIERDINHIRKDALREFKKISKEIESIRNGK